MPHARSSRTSGNKRPTRTRAFSDFGRKVACGPPRLHRELRKLSLNVLGSNSGQVHAAAPAPTFTKLAYIPDECAQPSLARPIQSRELVNSSRHPSGWLNEDQTVH